MRRREFLLSASGLIAGAAGGGSSGSGADGSVMPVARNASSTVATGVIANPSRSPALSATPAGTKTIDAAGSRSSSRAAADNALSQADTPVWDQQQKRFSRHLPILAC